jgi:hypothetical protein
LVSAVAGAALSAFVAYREGHPSQLAPYFERFEKVGEVTTPYARERGLTIYLGTGPSPALLARATSEHRAELAMWEGNLK